MFKPNAIDLISVGLTGSFRDSACMNEPFVPRSPYKIQHRTGFFVISDI